MVRTMTGDDLKRRRENANVSQAAIAAAGGWAHRSRIAHIEAQAQVTVVTAERFLIALQSLVKGK